MKCFEEFIRQKSRFSQFWTFTPIISTLLEHLGFRSLSDPGLPRNIFCILYCAILISTFVILGYSNPSHYDIIRDKVSTDCVINRVILWNWAPCPLSHLTLEKRLTLSLLVRISTIDEAMSRSAVNTEYLTRSPAHYEEFECLRAKNLVK